jgi:isopentenyldiphosphate isomerase
MNDELFDVYTREGKYLGIKPKSFCHTNNAGVYHKPVWIWIINDSGQILVQKRAKCKKNHPGLYDMPSAGHVDAGEEIIDGCIRETYEELGIHTKKEDYEFITEYIADKAWEIAQIYLLRIPSNSVFRLDEKEVEEVKWLILGEFKHLFYSDKFVGHNKDYKDMVANLLEKKLKA